MGQQQTYDHNRVAELVSRLGRAVHCLQFSAGLNPAQWESLRYLARANRYSRSPTALAEFLGTTKGTASQTIRALEAKGYVRRARGTADRRSIDLDLTPEGAALLERDPILRLDLAAAGLAPEEGGAIADGLSRILGELQSGCGMRPFGVCERCGHLQGDVEERDAAAHHRCGFTGDSLGDDDRERLCVNFRDQR